MNAETVTMQVTNYRKAEMMIQFYGEMLMKNRPNVANWAKKESLKYCQREMKIN
ncbi:hypothetical protein WKH57_25545 [Niallia taxi]|uniref:hypothetical protein n=1 Tax=Niallia taxi TaxID=2499688 RepID=UPI00316BA05B